MSVAKLYKYLSDNGIEVVARNDTELISNVSKLIDDQLIDPSTKLISILRQIQEQTLKGKDRK